LTLKSVFAARQSVKVTYFLVDGGSSIVEKDKIRKFLKTRITSNILVEFIDLDENLGYSGGNNIGIRRALDMGCSHICLLNPDVVVTDFWLERLLDCGELFVSPVSNSVGNEQTVPINYHVERNETSFNSVNRFARKWAQAFHKCSTPADFLGFFCVLINRKVFDRVGPLDERFFPGGFENIDYCIRARKAGFNLAIARHVYLHHWGSASFSNLSMSKRRHYISVNRTRLEKKHSFFWVDWKYTVILSATCDMSRAKKLFSPSLRSFQRDILS
jgi:GT2 family glycosyltransferase